MLDVRKIVIAAMVAGLLLGWATALGPPLPPSALAQAPPPPAPFLDSPPTFVSRLSAERRLLERGASWERWDEGDGTHSLIFYPAPVYVRDNENNYVAAAVENENSFRVRHARIIYDFENDYNVIRAPDNENWVLVEKDEWTVRYWDESLKKPRWKSIPLENWRVWYITLDNEVRAYRQGSHPRGRWSEEYRFMPGRLKISVRWAARVPDNYQIKWELRGIEGLKKHDESGGSIFCDEENRPTVIINWMDCLSDFQVSLYQYDVGTKRSTLDVVFKPRWMDNGDVYLLDPTVQTTAADVYAQDLSPNEWYTVEIPFGWKGVIATTENVYEAYVWLYVQRVLYPHDTYKKMRVWDNEGQHDPSTPAGFDNGVVENIENFTNPFTSTGWHRLDVTTQFLSAFYDNDNFWLRLSEIENGWNTYQVYTSRALLELGHVGDYIYFGSYESGNIPYLQVFLETAPSLTYPADGATIFDNMILLDWIDVSGASLYEIELDNDNDFSSTDVYIGTQASASAYTIYNLPYKRYWWRVRALDENEDAITDWSSPRSFTFDPTYFAGVKEINQIQVRFNWVTRELTKQVFDFTVWNKSTSARTLDCSIIFENVNVDPVDEIQNVYLWEWKKDPVDNNVKWMLVDRIGYLRSSTRYRDDFQALSLPAYGSSAVYGDDNQLESWDGVRFYRVEFEIFGIMSEGWGSKGDLHLVIDDYHYPVVAGGSWLAGWFRRRPITVTNSTASDLVNYEIKLTLSASDLTNVQSNFSDVRFTDEVGDQIYYWRESVSAGTSATFWVKVPLIPGSGSATIYVYYDNRTVLTSAPYEDATQVFTAYDDFEDQDIAEWGGHKGAATIVSDPVAEGKYALKLQESYTYPAPVVYWTGLNKADQAVSGWMRTPSVEVSLLIRYIDLSNYYYIFMRSGGSTTSNFRIIKNVAGTRTILASDNPTVSANTWYWVKAIVCGSDISAELYSAGGSLLSSLSATDTSIASGSAGFRANPSGGNNNLAGYFDRLVVRSYASPEPTTSLGSEEIANQPPNAPTDLLCEGATDPQKVTDFTSEFSAVHTDNDGDNALYYQIQVSTDNTFVTVSHWDSGQTLFASPVENNTRCPDITYGGSVLDRGVTYYWRIRFYDNAGSKYTAPPWSAVANFRLNQLPIVENVLTQNKDNPRRIDTFTPTFSWTFSDPDNDSQSWAEVEVGTTENDNSLWDAKLSTLDPTIKYHGAALERGVKYHIRVRAGDGGSNEENRRFGFWLKPWYTNKIKIAGENKFAWRFTATKTENVENLWVFLYETGQAPLYRLGIQSLNADGNPSGTWLSYGDFYPSGEWNQIDIPNLELAKDNAYAMVLENAQPVSENYVEVDVFRYFSKRVPTDMAWNPKLATMLYDGTSWSCWDNLGRFVLEFEDGSYWGCAIRGSFTINIDGDEDHFQRFVPSASFEVGYAVARLEAPAAGARLEWQLRENGVLIASDNYYSPIEGWGWHRIPMPELTLKPSLPYEFEIIAYGGTWRSYSLGEWSVKELAGASWGGSTNYLSWLGSNYPEYDWLLYFVPDNFYGWSEWISGTFMINQKPVVENLWVASSTKRVDRDKDADFSITTAVQIYIRVYDINAAEDIKSDNFQVKLYDNLNQLIATVSGATMTRTKIDENRVRFELSYNPSDSLFDNQLGGWDAEAIAVDNENSSLKSELRENQLFVVDDLDLSISLDDPVARYGQTLKVSGEIWSVVGENVWAGTSDVVWVDSMEATWTENKYSLSFAVSDSYGAVVSLKALARDYEASGSIDGISPSKSYRVNYPPEILSIEKSTEVVDRDDDLTGLGTPTTSITIKKNVRDNDGVGEILLLSAKLRIRDSIDQVIATLYPPDNRVDLTPTITQFSFSWDPPNDLADGSLGSFDVELSVEDNEGDTDLEPFTGMGSMLFVVDDLTGDSPVLSSTTPVKGSTLGVTGTGVRVYGPTSLDDARVVDSQLGAQPTTVTSLTDYEASYEVDLPKDTLAIVYVKLWDAPLDGKTKTSSYTVTAALAGGAIPTISLEIPTWAVPNTLVKIRAGVYDAFGVPVTGLTENNIGWELFDPLGQRAKTGKFTELGGGIYESSHFFEAGARMGDWLFKAWAEVEGENYHASATCTLQAPIENVKRTVGEIETRFPSRIFLITGFLSFVLVGGFYFMPKRRELREFITLVVPTGLGLLLVYLVFIEGLTIPELSREVLWERNLLSHTLFSFAGFPIQVWMLVAGVAAYGVWVKERGIWMSAALVGLFLLSFGAYLI